MTEAAHGSQRRVWVRLPANLEEVAADDHQATLDAQDDQAITSHEQFRWHPAHIVKEETDDKAVVTVEAFEDFNQDEEDDYHFDDTEENLINQQLTVPTSDIVARNNWEYPPHDLVQLVHLHEPAITQALLERYKCQSPTSGMKSIYTWCGPILLAVNPFQHMPHLYSASLTQTYIDQIQLQSQKIDGSSQETPPHAFAVAASAYAQLTDTTSNGISSIASSSPRKSQSILVSGESGAGKTETTKIVMRFLATVAKSKQLNKSNDTSDTSSEDSIEQRVLQSNPILEAFGNARTVRNDNSSRFGKFIRMRFSPDDSNHLTMVGASIKTYLLEKVRLVQQGYGERNYHIFYQLLYGATQEQFEACQLIMDGEPYLPTEFRFLNQNDCYDRRDGVDDVHEFQLTMDAMSVMGFSEEEKLGVLKIVSAVMFLGNIDFRNKENSDGELVENASTVEESLALENFGKLLGLDTKQIDSALCTRRVHIPGKTATPVKFGRQSNQAEDEEVFTKPLDVQHAIDTRDALAKSIYSKTFDWLVKRINHSIQSSESIESVRSANQPGTPIRTPMRQVASTPNRTPFATTSRSGSSGNNDPFVAVLDIFGFEIFEHNSFEQLCINYANERLQQQFNDYIFKHEQAMYNREQIKWSFIDFPSNADTVRLIEGGGTTQTSTNSSSVTSRGSTSTGNARGGMGILALLDDECKMPQGDDAGFAGKLYATCKGVPCFSVTKTQCVNLQFTVLHYAGTVVYDAHGFCDKNRDQLRQEALDLLTSTSMPLLIKILKSQTSGTKMSPSGTPGRRGTTSTGTPGSAARRGSARVSALSLRSLGSDFRNQLNSLIDTISGTEPHYIRCLKPNDAALAGSFDRLRVVSQLRCGGVLEAVRVARAGFPIRMPHLSFLTRYRSVLHIISLRFLLDSFGCQDSDGIDALLKQCQKFSANLGEVVGYGSQNSKLAKNEKSKLVGSFLKLLQDIDVFRGSVNTTSIATSKQVAATFRLRESCQLGVSKVFMRKRAHDLLESWLSLAANSAATKFNALARGAYTRSTYPYSFVRCKAASITLQCAIRKWRALAVLKEKQRLVAAITLQTFVRCNRARLRWLRMRKAVAWLQSTLRGIRGRAIAMEARRDQAALELQSWYRGNPARMRFLKLRAGLIVLQCKIRVIQARKVLRTAKAASRNLGAVQAENNRLKTIVSELKERITELEIENEKLRHNNNHLVEAERNALDASELNLGVQSVENTVTGDEIVNSDWYTETFKAELELAPTSSTNLESSVALHDSESVLSSEPEESDEMFRELRERQRQLVKQREALEAEKNLQSSIDQTQQQIVAESVIQSVMDDLIQQATHQAANEALQLEMEQQRVAHQQEKDMLLAKVANLEQQLVTSQSTSQQVANNDSQLEQQQLVIDQLRSQVESLESDRVTATNEHVVQIAELQATISQMTQDTQDAVKQAVESAEFKLMDSYSLKIENLKEESSRQINALQRDHDETLSRLHAEHQAKLSELHDKVVATEVQLGEYSKERSARSVQLNEVDSVHRKQTEHLQDQLNEAREEAMKLRQQRALQTTALEAFKSTMSTKVELLESEIQNTTQQLKNERNARMAQRLVYISSHLETRLQQRQLMRVWKIWNNQVGESQYLDIKGNHVELLLQKSRLKRCFSDWRTTTLESVRKSLLIERYTNASKHKKLARVLSAWREQTKHRIRNERLVMYHEGTRIRVKLLRKLFSRWSWYTHLKQSERVRFEQLDKLFDLSKQRRNFRAWKTLVTRLKQLEVLETVYVQQSNRTLLRKCFQGWRLHFALNATSMTLQQVENDDLGIGYPERMSSSRSLAQESRGDSVGSGTSVTGGVDIQSILGGASGITGGTADSVQLTMLSEVLEKLTKHGERFDELERQNQKLQEERLQWLSQGTLSNSMNGIRERKTSQDALSELVSDSKGHQHHGRGSSNTFSSGGNTKQNRKHSEDFNDDDSSDFYTVHDRTTSLVDPSTGKLRSPSNFNGYMEMESLNESEFDSNSSNNVMTDGNTRRSLRDEQTNQVEFDDVATNEIVSDIQESPSPAMPPLPPSKDDDLPKLSLDASSVQHESSVNRGTVELLIEQAKSKGIPVLLLATQTGSIDAVKQLLWPQGDHSGVDENGGNVSVAINVDVSDSKKRTALHHAVQLTRLFSENALAIANLLLEGGAKPDLKSTEGYTPLFEACRLGDEAVGITKALLRHGAKLNGQEACDPVGKSPLHAAVGSGARRTIHELLMGGANFNAVAQNGWTAFHLAASKCSIPALQTLLSHAQLEQSQVYKVQKNGTTPSRDSSQGTNKEEEESFFSSPSGSISSLTPTRLISTLYNSLGSAGEQAKNDGVKPGSLEVPDINSLDTCLNNALHIAAIGSSPHMPTAVKLLLEHGVRADAMNLSGQSPLHLLCSNHHSKKSTIASYIEAVCKNRHMYNNVLSGFSAEVGTEMEFSNSELDIDPLLLFLLNMQDREGRTPLHYAAMLSGDYAKVLVQYGAGLYVPTSGGFTPMDISSKQQELGKLLLVAICKRPNLAHCKYIRIKCKVTSCMVCLADLKKSMMGTLDVSDCRHCGRAVCSDCAQQQITIPKLEITTKVRVCKHCFSVLEGIEAPRSIAGRKLEFHD